MSMIELVTLSKFRLRSAHLAIPLIERLDIEKHDLVVGAGHNSVVLAPRHEYHLVAKIPFAVAVPEVAIIQYN